jgi:hypothetical protein
MDNIKKNRDYLATWLTNHQMASEVAPAVREALDEAEWALGVLRDRPIEAINLSTLELDKEAGHALTRIESVLPQMPDYHAPLGLYVNSISTSSTSASVSYVHAVGQIGTPDALRFAKSKSDEYRKLQESHQRPQKVRSLIEDLMPDLIGRFDTANRAIQQCRLGIGAKSSAALELRNLVDGLQGHLFAKAGPLQRGKMTWTVAAERLFGPGTTRAATMISQSVIRASLYGDLSDVAKDREGTNPRGIDDLAARVLDHLFAVLSLLKSTAQPQTSP